MAIVDGALRLIDTTAPLILGYDATGAADVVLSVSASGDLTITPDGGDVTILGGVAVIGTLDVTGIATFTNNIRLPDGYTIRWGNDGARLFFNGGDFRLDTGGLQRLNITSAGVLGVGNVITTSAANGDVVLKNDAKLRAVNAAGTDTVFLIQLLSSNKVYINCNNLELAFAGASTRTTIGANGAATALTANPLGYFDVNIGGVAGQIPYYSRGA